MFVFELEPLPWRVSTPDEVPPWPLWVVLEVVELVPFPVEVVVFQVEVPLAELLGEASESLPSRDEPLVVLLVSE